jgi:hypothetical protein
MTLELRRVAIGLHVRELVPPLNAQVPVTLDRKDVTPSARAVGLARVAARSDDA